MDEKGRGRFERNAARKQFSGAQASRFFIIKVGDKSHLSPGVWSRVGFFSGKSRIRTSLKPILMFVNAAQYKRMFNLPDVVERVVKRDLSFEFNKAMEQALRTAK
jgi:hypothetical protein